MAKEFKNLVEILEHSVATYKSSPLFGTKTGGSYKWTSYGEFGVQVEQFRGALADMGVQKGDTVAVIANNRVEWAVGAYATYSLGARYCPMYEAQLVKDWTYILRDSGAKVALVANQVIYDQVKPLIDELDSLERVIYFDGPRDSEDSYQTLLDHGAKTPAAVVHPDEDDVCGFIYTSGTTGDPKGVLLSHKNIMSNVNGVHQLLEIGPDDVSLSFLPWAHSFGQVVELHCLLSMGAALGIAENVNTIIENLSEVRPTLLFAVPRIFNRIYNGVQQKMEAEGGIKQMLFTQGMANSEALRGMRERGESGGLTAMMNKFYDKLVFSKVRARFGGRLKYAFSGGAALSPEVARFIDNLNITVYEGYGLTETSPIATCNSPANRKIGSVGRPIPGVAITIADVEGYPSGTGEICVKGPNVMQGYHNLPEQTAKVLDEDGTFHTGDLGRVDEDGFVWILGRVKEQYKLENGKYVVPGPIEEQLKLSPYVNQVMVEGTNKAYNVALIVVDLENLGSWADKNGVPRDELLTHPKVKELYQKEIDRVSASLKGYERPKRFALIEEEFSADNDMLTPKLSVKRRVVMARYGDMINNLYNDDKTAAA
ncbi:long-chain fatty acid--CoA ligase [Bradymonadaceae bacterium TMQ3]|nr:long-chain fatty acid--CoA ligase [Bradymonadaceae bacterium TMQ3]TXC73127.1 long-chain fatty acid--CoA ligase [Bradymonadales bacterium TMQ1]